MWTFCIWFCVLPIKHNNAHIIIPIQSCVLYIENSYVCSIAKWLSIFYSCLEDTFSLNNPINHQRQDPLPYQCYQCSWSSRGSPVAQARLRGCCPPTCCRRSIPTWDPAAFLTQATSADHWLYKKGCGKLCLPLLSSLPLPRAVLSNVVATSHMHLLKCKWIKITITIPQSH